MTTSCSSGIKRTSQGLLFKNGCVFFSAFLLCFPLSLAATITVINGPVTAALRDDVTLGISINESVALCTWYRGAVDVTNMILRVLNGAQTVGPQYTRRESLLQPSHSLRIANATLADSGTYWVRITFTPSAEDAESNLTLKVLGRVSKPFITSNKTSPVENDTVALNCNTSDTDVSYQWFKNNESIDTNGRLSFENNNRTLTVSQITRFDMGSYKCVVLNAISNASSDPFFFNINYGPETPNISLTPKMQIFPSGSDVTFSCSADSNPAAGYKWSHNGLSLNKNESSFVITGIRVNQSGNYTCNASNSITMKHTASTVEAFVQDALEPSHLPAGAIVGIVIAVIVIVGAITGLIYYIVTKTGVTRGSGSSGPNEMNSKSTYNTGDKGAENQSVQEEPQYSSPTFKPSSPMSADTTINSSTDKTVYALVNAPKR